MVAPSWRGPLGWLLFVSFVLLTPAAMFPSPPSVGGSIRLDKVVHFCLFFGLSRSWFVASAGATRMPLGGIPRLVVCFLMALGLAAALEGVQTLLTWRSGEGADIVAGALGALAGVSWARWRSSGLDAGR